MNSVVQSYQSFLDRWCDTYHGVEKVTLDEVIKAERDLAFKFPQFYLDCVTQLGVSGTSAALLDQIVDRNLSIRDISELHHPNKIFENMRGWQSAGMPDGLIPIASDCMGNSFCFDADDGKIERATDAKIYFFDHDSNEIEVELEAETFASWIAGFNAIASN